MPAFRVCVAECWVSIAIHSFTTSFVHVPRCVPVVTKSTLAPFACVTRNGVSTMAAEPSVLCNIPGGPHQRMRSVASVMLLLFVVGVPAAFGAVVSFNRAAIVADQELRMRGEGDVALTNPNIRMRRRFRKLYEVRCLTLPAIASA